LELLDVSQTQVTHTIWTVSPPLPRLATLIIAKTHVDDGDDWCQQMLACTPGLRAIDVSHTRIVERGVVLLQERGVQRIVVDGCRGVTRATRSLLRSTF
jgi:hypothetical protein